MVTTVLPFPVSALKKLQPTDLSFSSGSFRITCSLWRSRNQVFLNLIRSPQCKETFPEAALWFVFAAFFQAGNAKGRSTCGLSVLDTLPKGLAVITRTYAACFAGHLTCPESAKNPSIPESLPNMVEQDWIWPTVCAVTRDFTTKGWGQKELLYGKFNVESSYLEMIPFSRFFLFYNFYRFPYAFVP